MNFRHLRVPLQLSLIVSITAPLASAQTGEAAPPSDTAAPPTPTHDEDEELGFGDERDEGANHETERAATPDSDGAAAPALSPDSVGRDASQKDGTDDAPTDAAADARATTGGETDTSGIPPEFADRLVMPKLQKFESAPYPEQALRDGVEGSVVLSLTISPEGAVTEAEVQEPAGHGFDESAQAAALKFQFAPATLDGEPIPVKILYRYDFTLDEPEADPDLPTTGEIDGVVTIAQLDSTVVGATVVATSPEGDTYETRSDARGRWSLIDLPPGDYVVTVTADGFEVGQFAVTVQPNEGISLEQELYPKGNTADVIVRGVRPPRSMTKRTLSEREISRIPGTGGDALRSLQSMPGVARAPGLAGLLIIRGSAPRDSMTYINGMTAPLIYHFGGLSSVIPTELIDEIDFYPGNFSAKYGRLMGGIVDVKMRSPDTQCTGDYGQITDEVGCFHGMLELDMIQGRFMFQGPLDADNDWTFAVAARRSWMDLWLGPVLEAADAGVTQAPVYHDYQVIVETEPTPTSKLALRFLGSSDRFEALITEPAAQDPAFGGELTFGTAFLRGQVEYDAKLSSTVDVTTMFSIGRTEIDFGIGDLAFDLLVHPIEFRSEFGVELFPGARLNLGLDFLALPYDIFVRAPEPPRPGEPARGPFSTQPLLETAEDGTHFRPGVYAEAEISPLAGLRVVPGVRFDYYTDTDHTDVSPRINAAYDVIPGGTDANGDVSDKTTLKAGVGVYTQPPTFQETDPVFGTAGLLSNRSIQYSLGIEQEIAQLVDVNVEGFYKDLTDLVSRDETPGGVVYNNEGSGSIIGLETLIKYKTDERFFGWIAYTLSKSVRQNSPEDDEYFFNFDQTHNLTVLGSYRLGRGWELGARFRLASGNLTTPVAQEPALQSLYASDVGTYTPLQGAPFSVRLPLFHALDIRIDKRWQFRTWRLSAYLDVRNVYNNAAKEAIVYNFDYTQSAFQLGLPILPSIGLRGEF